MLKNLYIYYFDKYLTCIFKIKSHFSDSLNNVIKTFVSVIDIFIIFIHFITRETVSDIFNDRNNCLLYHNQSKYYKIYRWIENKYHKNHTYKFDINLKSYHKYNFCHSIFRLCAIGLIAQSYGQP